MKPCLFCQIVCGEAPAARIYEDEVAVGFLDHRPVFPGHVLLVPREHHETLADLPRARLEPLFHAAQILARALEAGLGADGSFVAMNNRVSQSVPHLHVHLVPRRRKDGLRGFFWPRFPYQSPQAMAEVQQALIAAVAAQLGEQ